MEEIKHIVTQEDLDNNVAFASTGAKVGDEVPEGTIEEIQDFDKKEFDEKGEEITPVQEVKETIINE